MSSERSNGNTKITRTVDDLNPGPWELVKVSVKFERRALTVVEWIHEVKDLHDPCLEYVPGSANVDGAAAGNVEVTPDFAKVKGDWDVYPNIQPKSKTFNFRYTVLPGCERGVEIKPSGMHYNGTLGSGTYDNKGPFITVKAGGAPTKPLIPGFNPGGPGGLGSLGPLGSLFGGFGS